MCVVFDGGMNSGTTHRLVRVISRRIAFTSICIFSFLINMDIIGNLLNNRYTYFPITLDLLTYFSLQSFSKLRLILS